MTHTPAFGVASTDNSRPGDLHSRALQSLITPQVAALLTVVISATALAVCITELGFAFGRSIDFGDEGNGIYLLSHPRAVTIVMDQFVWGQIARAFALNIVGLRWLTLAIMLACNVLLCVSCFRSISGHFSNVSVRTTSWCLVITLSTLGSLLFFGLGAWEINYTGTLVLTATIIGACLFARKAVPAAWRTFLDVVMGLMVAFAFMSRAPDAILLLLLIAFGAWLLDIRQILRCLVVTTAAFVLAIVAALFAGYDITDQIRLISVLAGTGHRPLDLLRADIPRGTEILLTALSATAAFAFAERRFGWFRGQRFGAAVLVALICAVTVALGYMAARGYVAAAPPNTNPLYANRLLSSLAPAIHAAAIGLLLIAAAPRLAARIPQLQKWCRADGETISLAVFKAALLLYLICLVPQVGTNNGILNRPVGLGPVFLAVALLLVNELRNMRVAQWMIPAVVFLVSMPVIADLYAKTIAHARVNGSAFDQTAVLDHPALFRGLAVTPSIAAFQRNLEQSLASAGFDRGHDVILPATREMGILSLVGASAFTGGPALLEEDENSFIWNCAVIEMGLRRKPRRIFVLDFGQIDRRSQSCLRGYTITKSLPAGGSNSLAILSRRE